MVKSVFSLVGAYANATSGASVLPAPRAINASDEPGTAPSPRGRVLFVTDSLRMGGAETTLVSMLQGLQRVGYDVRVCALDVREGNPVEAILRQRGIPVNLVQIRRLRDIAGVVRLSRFLGDFAPDLVHTQLEWGNVLGTIIARWHGISVVSTLHMIFERRPDMRGRGRQLVERLILERLSDMVICVSDAVRRSHGARNRLLADKLVVLHNGIEIGCHGAAPPGRRQRTRSALGIAADASIILTVSVLRPAKGLRFMLEAMPRVCADHPAAVYLIVGDGDDRAALEAHATRLGLGNRVIFTGARDDVPALLEAADLFVLPTEIDAWPTVVMEAMAAGLPVVATRTGGLPEMFDDGQGGVLVDARDPAALGDAVTAILADPKAIGDMGQTARRLALSRFNVEDQVATLAGQYDRLIGNRR